MGTTVFGLGVLTIDMLGLLGHQGQADSAASDNADDADGGDADGAHGGADDSSGDDADGDAGHSGDSDDAQDADAGHDAASGHTDDGGHGHELVEIGTHAVSTVMHDKTIQGNALLKTLSILRTAVYFSAGFGPVGLFAWLTKQGALASILWSVPVGLATALITRLLMHLFKKDVDSSVKEDELLLERGQVIVTIGRGELGKVRIHMGDIYADRFARAKSKEETIPVGAAIRVCDIEEDCLIVEREGV